MNAETMRWVLAFHVVGDVLWVAGLTAVVTLLQLHPSVDEASRPALTQAQKRLAIVMDVGATLAIAMGLWAALDRVPNAFATGAWLHIKLTAVVFGVLTVHGMARVKIKKFAKGDLKPLPFAVWILLGAGVLTAILFGVNDSLMRK
jgi:uncharacterized membrane protein